MAKATEVSTGELRRAFSKVNTDTMCRVMRAAGIEPLRVTGTLQKQHRYWPRRAAVQAMIAYGNGKLPAVKAVAKKVAKPEQFELLLADVPEVQDTTPLPPQEDAVLRELREIKDLLRQLVNVWR